MYRFFFCCVWLFMTINAVKIGVITSGDEHTESLALATQEVVASIPEFEEAVDITWIRSDVSPLAVTAALTQAYSVEHFHALFGSSSRCSTQLELAAAWNMLVFTYGCSQESLALLRSSTVHPTHVRLDLTTYSIIPYIDAFFQASLQQQNTLYILVASPSYQDAAKELIAITSVDILSWKDYRTDSNPTKRRLSLIVLTSELELDNLEELPFNSWETVLFASVDHLDYATIGSLTTQWNATSQFAILPKTETVDLSGVLYVHYFKIALKLYLVQESQTAKSLGSTRDVSQFLDELRNSCREGLFSENICFDKRTWSIGVGSIQLFKYMYHDCNGRATSGEFQHYQDFIPVNQILKLQKGACADSLTKFPITVMPGTDGEDGSTGVTAAVIIICVLLVLILLAIILVIWCKFKRKSSRGFTSKTPSWLLSAGDIIPFEQTKNGDDYDMVSIFSEDARHLITSKPDQNFFTDNQKFEAVQSSKSAMTDFGYFRDQPVSLKKFANGAFIVTRVVNRDLEAMVNMHHENIAIFFGVCLNPTEIILVTQYCIKGSLEEIFLFEPVHFDETFIASLVTDIIRGMVFLHKSSVGIHGNLKSSNCLVTGRWVVKLSDFGLVNLRNKFREDRDLLWSAPEVIKQKELASQKADVYSFGVILYELIGKQGPFGRGYTYSEPDLRALLSRIVEFGYHPETSWLCCEDYLKNCMLSCWQTPSKLRPDFTTLNSHLKPFRAVLNGRSIVDNMLVIMERYQMRLEDLVDERTSQLLLEKKKTENLLHRMLPPQVADQLVSGKKVAPEFFSCITVFFSDICDFTNFASNSSPIQVISLLNDLYTIFDAIIRHYDVYKVETVGDAYLCVSGLPKPNGDSHAAEIALMALEFMKALRNFKMNHHERNGHLQMRIGIHSGPCVAGVVGVSMPRYTLFGDTVNVASRLETTSEPMKIQISTKTKSLLDKIDGFVCEKRGTVNLKGKGEMETYWLVASESLLNHSAMAGLKVPADTLRVPGSGDVNSNSSSDVSCDSNSSRPGTHLSYTDSIKSYGSAVSAPIFQRAGSFRQRVKSASYNNSQDNVNHAAGGVTPVNCEPIPMITISDHDDSKLLNHATSTNSITIQIDQIS